MNSFWAKPTERFTTWKKNDKPFFSKSSNNNDTRSTLAFRKNRDALTAHTFSEFNQRAFQDALSSVTVTWSKNFNKTAGVTRMRGKLGEDNAHTRVATIALSTKVIDDEERLRSTLVHEMCHAAQWLVSLSYYFREVCIDDCLGSLAASLAQWRIYQNTIT